MAAGAVVLAVVATTARVLSGAVSAAEWVVAALVMLALSIPALLAQGSMSVRGGLLAFLWLGSGATVATASLQGGTGAIVLAWLPVGLVLAGLVGERRTLLWLMLADVLAVSGLGVWGSLGLLPAQPDDMVLHETVNMAGMVLAVGAGVVVFLHRHRRERERIEEQQEWLELLATEARVGAVMVDQDRILLANPQARAMLGLPEEPSRADLPDGLLDLGAGPVHELSVGGADEPRWLEVQCSELAGRRPGLTLLTLVDISERRAAERTRIRDEAEEVRRRHLAELGALAGGLAHDLNNLLAAVLANAEMLREIDEPELEQDMVDDIHSAASQSADIIRQLLAYTGKSRAIRRPIEVVPLVDSVARVARAEAGQKGVEIEVGRASASGLWVAGDEVELRQLIGNLVSNAVRATEPGGRVELRVETSDLDAAQLGRARLGASGASPGTYVTVTVEDRGCGIAPRDLDRVFEPLFTTRSEGRGLGLAAVRGVVERGGGVLWLQSQPDVGTVFRIAFPVAGAPVSARVDAPRADAPPSRRAAGQGSGQRILVLDDEPLVRALMGRLLQRAGYSPVDAADLDEALRHAEAGPLDGAVIDFLMPDVTGDVALERLREVQAGLPAVLCSGYISSDRPDVVRGFSEVIAKPFAEQDLLAAIARSLGAERSRDPSGTGGVAPG